ncbi:MAG: RNA polymerase sigma factor [Steroidobacteraceae bacterium]
MPQAASQRHIADWFRRWRNPLRKFLANRGAVRVADLDDIAQEVFLRLLRYRASEVVEHPQAYLFKIAANVAAEWAIRARHRYAHEPQWLDDLAVEGGMEEACDDAAAQREIRRAIGTLTSRERSILKLHFEEGLTHAQIAKRLEVSLRVVRRDFEKSYGKLRDELRLRHTGALDHGCE